MQAAAAGLGGLAWAAGGVLLLDRAATIAAAQEKGLFLWSRGA
ncbi:MAG: UDP-2,3-diacylglucosamine diphosphatase LpxI domain-containing protein [Cereibacter sp.]